MRTHVLPAFKTLKLSEITKKQINAFRNQLYNQGYSGSYINQCLSALSQMLKQAEDEELIQAVPSNKRASAKPRRTKVILTIEETNRLFSFR
jgi:site-specific recombinase XerD